MIDWILNSAGKSKVQGKYNFYIQANPDRIDSSTTISIMTFASKEQKAAIPCIYRWSLLKNGVIQEIPQFKGSSFICQPNHIGSTIQAEIISTDHQFNGKALLTFGPVQLDVSLKTEISNALSHGMLTLPIYLISPDNEEKECQLRLFQNQIKINHAYSQLNYSFDYSIFQPMIIINPKENNKIGIHFNQKYQNELRKFQKNLFYPQQSQYSNSRINYYQNPNQPRMIEPRLQIKFLNRSSKDIFLFTMKAFIAKKEMKSSAVIKRLQNINFDDNQTFSQILEIESLKNDIIRYDKLYKKSIQDKKKLSDESRRLEQEIEDIIVTYTKIVEDKFRNNLQSRNNLQLNHNFSILSTKRDEIMSRRNSNYSMDSAGGINGGLNGLSNGGMNNNGGLSNGGHNNGISNGHNNGINSRLKLLTEEIDQVRFNKTMHMSQASHHNQLAISNVSGVHNGFQKKKESKNGSILDILDEIQRKDQGYFDNHQETTHLKQRISQLEGEKRQLEMKLSKSFEKIDNLERSAFKNSPQASFIQNTNPATPINASPINFTYNHRKSEQSPTIRFQTATSTVSVTDNDKLIKQINEKNNEIKQLVSQKEELSKQRQAYEQKCLKLQRQVSQQQIELQMLKKNSDALNRSQHLSLQMDNYNQEQIAILKEHNNFLTTENEKLAKACEKYMADAKAANKLRQQIIQLKEKINSLQSLNHTHSNNPENNSLVTSIYL